MISTGTYYPNEAGALSLKDAKPLRVDGKRVSVVVSENEVVLFVGGEVKVVEGPSKFESTAQLYAWAQLYCATPDTSLPLPVRQYRSAVQSGWTIEHVQLPYPRWDVYRPDGSRYGYAASQVGARLMRTRAYLKTV